MNNNPARGHSPKLSSIIWPKLPLVYISPFLANLSHIVISFGELTHKLNEDNLLEVQKSKDFY